MSLWSSKTGVNQGGLEGFRTILYTTTFYRILLEYHLSAIRVYSSVALVY